MSEIRINDGLRIIINEYELIEYEKWIEKNEREIRYIDGRLWCIKMSNKDKKSRGFINIKEWDIRLEWWIE